MLLPTACGIIEAWCHVLPRQCSCTCLQTHLHECCISERWHCKSHAFAHLPRLGLDMYMCLCRQADINKLNLHAVPPTGGMSLTIDVAYPVGVPDGMPTASTCFAQVKLPYYSTRTQFYERMQEAIPQEFMADVFT